MELIFLGTSAGVPTRHRNMTSILLNLQQPTLSQMWLFDCGEGTQHQFLKTSHHPGKLDKIFITHLHGDHLFGLPGLLCLSGSWTDYPLAVEEISAGEVFDDGLFKVTAYPLNHPVECFGYRIEQHDKPGPLDAQRLLADGIKAGPLFQQLKKGQTVEMPDGRIVNGQDYLGPSTPGIKLAIFGDTAPCPAALEMAKEVDVMVHETTLEHEMAEKANSRGHSSSIQTAELARDARVGKLIITHVSSRYDWEGCQRLLAECRSVFEPCELAEDFRVFPLA
jgi:ribonuclease Z